MTQANDYQIDGTHYKDEAAIQHWDYAAAHNFDYFQGQITKYVTRWKKKNGIKDLEKARHFIEKYIEIETAKHQIQKNQIAEEILGSKKALASLGIKADSLKDWAGMQRPALPKRTGQEHPFGFHDELEKK